MAAAEISIRTALALVDCDPAIRGGAMCFRRSTRNASIFAYTCKVLALAQERGLTGIREFKRDDTGELDEIVFEEVLTELGRKLMSAQVSSAPCGREGRTEAMSRHLTGRLAAGLRAAGIGSLINSAFASVAKAIRFLSRRVT